MVNCYVHFLLLKGNDSISLLFIFSYWSDIQNAYKKYQLQSKYTWFDLSFKHAWINFFLFIVDLVYKPLNGLFKLNTEWFFLNSIDFEKKNQNEVKFDCAFAIAHYRKST